MNGKTLFVLACMISTVFAMGHRSYLQIAKIRNQRNKKLAHYSKLIRALKRQKYLAQRQASRQQASRRDRLLKFHMN